MKKYLAIIVVTFLVSCTKEVIINPKPQENQKPIVNIIDYKGLSSNQINLLSKEYIDVMAYDSKANCWLYGDFDLDGMEDVMAFRLSNKPILLKNQGNNVFLKVTDVFDEESYSVWPRSCISGDFNNDGYLDAVIFSHEFEGANGGENVVLLINQNGKSFKSKIISPVIRGTTKNFWHLGSSADIDKDGDIDILMSTAGQQYLMINDGNSNFSLSTNYEQSLQNSHLIGGLLEDLNKDGYTDYFTFGHEFAQIGLPKYHNGPAQTRIMWGNSNNSFLFFNSTTFSMDTTGFALLLDAICVDLNKDGKNELVVLRTGDPDKSGFYKGYKISVYDVQSLKDITPELYGNNTYNTNANWIFFIKIIDINNDGKLDIVDCKKRSNIIFYQK
jgi:hypothetical protein